MLLEIPEQDLAAAIGCLALGTLYALRSGDVPPGTGEVLSFRIKNPLRGKVPPLLIDALNCMDEIHVFDHPGFEQRRIDMIDRLIKEIEWILREQAHIRYDLGWVEDLGPADSDAVSGRGLSGETRFPYPVDSEQVLRAVGSSFRSQSGDESERWVTFEEIMGRLGRADAHQVRPWIDRLLLLEQLEEAPEGDRWRPTRAGWEQYHYDKRMSRPGLWDQYGIDEDEDG
jgi:hypothetical protein